MSAAGEGNEEIVRLLLERGANINAANDVSVRFIELLVTGRLCVCVCVCVCVCGTGYRAHSPCPYILNMTEYNVMRLS
jgi:Ankyrin repeat